LICHSKISKNGQKVTHENMIHDVISYSKTIIRIVNGQKRNIFCPFQTFHDVPEADFCAAAMDCASAPPRDATDASTALMEKTNEAAPWTWEKVCGLLQIKNSLIKNARSLLPLTENESMIANRSSVSAGFAPLLPVGRRRHLP